MISGTKTARKIWRGILVAAFVAFALPAWAFGLDDLMAALARQPDGEARFTEQRFVHGFDGPLASAGTLSYAAPDRLSRKTVSPRPEALTVEGNTLTLSRGGRTRTLALDSMPELLGMVEAMRATLTGNAKALQRVFRVELSGSTADWSMDLTPIDERLAAAVKQMRMTGRAGQVLGIDMTFVGGDRSVMTIVPGTSGGIPPVAINADADANAAPAAHAEKTP